MTPPRTPPRTPPVPRTARESRATLLSRLLRSVRGEGAPSASLPRGTIGNSVAGGLFASGGAYTGASRAPRSLRDWMPRSASADTEQMADLPSLRARAEDLTRNAPIATGARATILTSTIGGGLTPWPRLDRALLGLDDEAADAWERHVRRLWAAWADTTACDLTRRTTFAGLTVQVLSSAWTRGDVFVVRRTVPASRTALFRTRLQVVEADRVSNPNFALNTDRLMGGVELDADGAPVAYHIMNRHPGDVMALGGGTDWKWDRLPAVGPVSGEPLVYHVFRGDRPSQTRGVPALAPVIEMLKQLDRYSGYELDAAALQAAFTVFITQQVVDDTSGFAAEPTSEPAVAGAPSEFRLGSGAVLGLAPGEDVRFADPTRPNEKFDPFVLALLRQVGVALELPYELLIKHFTASYSASRAAIIEAWRATLMRREWIVRDFCQPAYAALVTEAVARGYLDAPGFFRDPLRRQAYTTAVWTGPAMAQLNPVDEATAADLRVTRGFSTLQAETAALTGGDWETNHQQAAKELRMRQAAGLVPAPAPAPAAPAPAMTPAMTPPTMDAMP